MQTPNTRTASIRDLVSTLFIYKGTILFFTILCGAAAGIVSYLTPDRYEASVQVWAQDQSGALGLRSGLEFAADQAARVKLILANAREIMLSRNVLETTLLDSESRLDVNGSNSLNAEDLNATIAKFRKRIKVESPKGQDYGSVPMFLIKYRDEDARRAEHVLTVLLETFKDRYSELSSESATHQETATQQQVEAARMRLSAAEQTLDQFVKRLGTGVTELQFVNGRTGNGESELRRSLLTISDRLVQVETEIAERRTLLEQLRLVQAASGDALVVPPRSSQDYASLDRAGHDLSAARVQMHIVRASLKPANPQYQDAADRLEQAEASYRHEVELAMGVMDTELNAKQKTVDDLRSKKNSYAGELAKLVGESVEYQRISDEQARCKLAVDDAERRHTLATNSLLNAAQEALFATVDVPKAGTKPVSPMRLLNTAVGVLLGLLSGIGMAFLAHQYSRTVRSEADLTSLGQDFVVVSLPRVRKPLQRAG